MLHKALSRDYFRFMWALLPVKPTAEGFNLHLEKLSNCQVSSNPKHPKNLFPNFVTALFSFLFFSFLFFSSPLWVGSFEKFLRRSPEFLVLLGFSPEKNGALAGSSSTARSCQGSSRRRISRKYPHLWAVFSSCG